MFIYILGDIGKFANYRSIIIVCILSKVLDSYILEYVVQFIPKNYLKLGYVKGGGCEKACLC